MTSRIFSRLFTCTCSFRISSSYAFTVAYTSFTCTFSCVLWAFNSELSSCLSFLNSLQIFPALQSPRSLEASLVTTSILEYCPSSSSNSSFTRQNGSSSKLKEPIVMVRQSRWHAGIFHYKRSSVHNDKILTQFRQLRCQLGCVDLDAYLIIFYQLLYAFNKIKSNFNVMFDKKFLNSGLFFHLARVDSICIVSISYVFSFNSQFQNEVNSSVPCAVHMWLSILGRFFSTGFSFDFIDLLCCDTWRLISSFVLGGGRLNPACPMTLLHDVTAHRLAMFVKNSNPPSFSYFCTKLIHIYV